MPLVQTSSLPSLLYSVPQKADFMHSLTSVFRLSFTNQRCQKEMRGKEKRAGYSFYTPSAMDSMFVFPHIHVLKSHPSGMVLGGGAFGRRLNHEGGGLMNGISALM